MKVYTIEVSDDASGILTEMQTRYHAKPETVIRLCIESMMADALSDEDVYQLCVEKALDDPDAIANHYWNEAIES